MSEQTHREAGGNEAIALSCPACGASARRASAHFCATCGRGLRQRTYAPADSLLASYHQQRNRPALLIEQELNSEDAQHARLNGRLSASRMFEGGSALVFVILSFAPFIGILFCPCAAVLGAIDLRRSQLRAGPAADGRTRIAVFTMICGVLVFGAQLFLWWSLYVLTK